MKSHHNLAHDTKHTKKLKVAQLSLKTSATRYIAANGKILKQSRDHSHAPFVGDMLSCC